MKKEYEKPIVEIEQLIIDNIITASGGFNKDGLDINNPDHMWDWSSENN